MKKILLILSAILLWSSSSMAQQIFGSDNGKAVTPVVQASAYSASNAMGGLQTVNVFRTPQNAAGILDNFWISSLAGNTAGMTIYIFDTQPSSSTTCTDKTAFVLANADVPKLALMPFIVSPATAQGITQSIAQQNQIATSVRNNDTVPTSNLYVCIVANGSVTPGSTSDLSFKISLVQD